MSVHKPDIVQTLNNILCGMKINREFTQKGKHGLDK